jgi:hypothetical protein
MAFEEVPDDARGIKVFALATESGRPSSAARPGVTATLNRVQDDLGSFPAFGIDLSDYAQPVVRVFVR